jgi:hypothetical protein
MDLLTAYGTDPTLEQEGVWSNEFRGGIEMKLRSSQSKEVKAAYERQNKRSERFWKTKQPIPEAIQVKNKADIAASAVADWRCRTIEYDDHGDVKSETVIAALPWGGEQLACTDDNKERVFKNPRLWSLCLDVIGQMNNVERYQLQSTEEGAATPPVALVSAPATDVSLGSSDAPQA